MDKIWIAFIVIAAVIFGLIITLAIVGAVTRANYSKKADFGYNVEKKTKISTGVPVLDEILNINPEFKNNGLQKTNLSESNRQSASSGVVLSYAQAIERFPEEKVRLGCYLKCLKKFGKDRVDVEFPIQVGSSKRYIDVAVFAGDENNKNLSKEHNILNLKFIFECKKDHANPNNKTPKGNPETMGYIMASGLNQLTSYMAVCPNIVEKTFTKPNGETVTKILGLGCLTNGSETKFYKKYTNMDTGNQAFELVATPSWY